MQHVTYIKGQVLINDKILVYYLFLYYNSKHSVNYRNFMNVLIVIYIYIYNVFFKKKNIYNEIYEILN